MRVWAYQAVRSNTTPQIDATVKARYADYQRAELAFEAALKSYKTNQNKEALSAILNAFVASSGPFLDFVAGLVEKTDPHEAERIRRGKVIP